VFIAALACLTASVRAELIQDAKHFLNDIDDLTAARSELASDRKAMTDDLYADKALRNDVHEFFADRSQASSLRQVQACDRKQLRLGVGYEPEKLAKPTKPFNDLLWDATSYLAKYDDWCRLQAEMEKNIEQIRLDTARRDEAALKDSLTAYFKNSRAKLQARLQWQSDLKAMKKDAGFKATGKAHSPSGTKLSDFTSAFLKDRADWEALAVQLEADRNNLRAALNANSSSLRDLVLIFLNDRRARTVKAQELALDRKAMAAELGTGIAKREGKIGALATSRDLDADDEDDALEQSPDSAGEK
jgi:hypothetical protein